MGITSSIKETLPSTASDGSDASTYRCVDCLTEYDDPRPLCPDCGGEWIEHA
jgi:rRNA maturation endonuclease Nob1